MNTTSGLLYSRDKESKWRVLDTAEPVIDVDLNAAGTEWGWQYVNQESKWVVLDTTESVIDKESVRPNVNDGTELWKANLRNGIPGRSSNWNDPREVCTGGKTLDMKLDPCIEQAEASELYMRKPWLGTPTQSGDKPFTTEQLRSMSTLDLMRLQKYRSRREMILNENRKQGGPSNQIEADPQSSVHHDGAGRVNTLDERPTKNCEDKNAVNGMNVGATGTRDDLPLLSAVANKLTSDIRKFMKSFF